MDIGQQKEKNKNLWNKEAYYQLIEDAQHTNGHEANFFSDKIAEVITNHNISEALDVGCGEGGIISHVAGVTSKDVQFTGIDVVEIGINRANKRGIGNATFKMYDGDDIPFENDTFDLSFSTFVFEHLTNPEQVFLEMTRVTKKDGYVLIACPNYGSPFFRSPCNKDSKTLLMIRRLFSSCIPQTAYKKSFHWQAVEPIILPGDQHIMDYDTTIEPNLYSFIKHIKENGVFDIVEASSYWSRFGNNGTTFFKKLFLAIVSWLGRKNTPVIRWYGPFFFILLQKKG